MRRIHLYMLLATLLSGCATSNRATIASNAPGADLPQVRVFIDGDVAHWGEFIISSDFEESSIWKAVGGYVAFSGRPKSFTLTREIDGSQKQIEIKFSDMPKLKAKGFRFLSNDHIVVRRMM